MKKIAFIIGGSSGIGYECCKELIEKGYKIYNGSRRNCELDNVNNIVVDVVNIDTIKKAVELILNKENKIDCFIYSAGFSMASPIEGVDEVDYKYLFSVNLFGLIDSIKEIVPIMKKQGGGRIISISSIGGIIPIPYDAYYSSSKAAVDMLIFNLNNELNRFNIYLTSVLPGGVRTSFTFKRKTYNNSLGYGDFENAVNSLAKIEQNGSYPNDIAKKVYQIIVKKNPPIITTVGFKNKLTYAFEKVLSKKIILKLVKKKFKQK